jgi:hypothetical protein
LYPRDVLYSRIQSQEYTNIFFALYFNLMRTYIAYGEGRKIPFFLEKYLTNWGLFRDARMGGVKHPYPPGVQVENQAFFGVDSRAVTGEFLAIEQ